MQGDAETDADAGADGWQGFIDELGGDPFAEGDGEAADELVEDLGGGYPPHDHGLDGELVSFDGEVLPHDSLSTFDAEVDDYRTSPFGVLPPPALVAKQAADGSAVDTILEAMQMSGVLPSTKTANAALRAYGFTMDAPEALERYDELCVAYGAPRDSESYELMAEILRHSSWPGRLSAAEALLVQAEQDGVFVRSGVQMRTLDICLQVNAARVAKRILLGKSGGRPVSAETVNGYPPQMLYDLR